MFCRLCSLDAAPEGFTGKGFIKKRETRGRELGSRVGGGGKEGKEDAGELWSHPRGSWTGGHEHRSERKEA